MDGPLNLGERQNIAHGVHEETLSALHIRGQDHYRQKEYEAALECFTKAISQDAKASVAILDNRAATYTKLGNLRAALNDGRQMIQQEKANCLGYLRTGKILQLLGNCEMALDLYGMGIRKVPSSNPFIMLLRRQHEKLTLQLAPPKAIDPLQMLPLELAEMTIKYLDFRHIVGLLRVSKTWLQLLISMPGLWSDLDFSTAKKPVTLGAVRKYIKQGNGATTRVTLDRFGYNAEKIPRYVASRCRTLDDLRIPGGFIGASFLEAISCASNLRTLIISPACEISFDVASQLLRHCSTLERAEFHSVSSVERRPATWVPHMRNLRTLVLDTPKGARKRGNAILDLDTLVTSIPSIQTLSVQGWHVLHTAASIILGQAVDFSDLRQLQTLNISRLKTILPPRLPSTIRTIAMTDCINFGDISTVSFADFYLPQLSRLSLAGWHQLSLGDLQACLTRNKGKLTHLDLRGCVNLSNANLGELITQGYLEGIEDLVLKSCNVDDEIAMLIARNVPRLKNLNLACTKITGVGVKALVIGLEAKLEQLCLDECQSINIDAVVLARKTGVKVAFGFPDSLSGGRRIKQR